MSATTHRRGFTFLELLVSLGIMAMLVALAAPMFGSNEALQLDITKRLLVSDLEYAQVLAIANPETEVALIVDEDGSGWSIATLNSPSVPLTNTSTGEPLVTTLGSNAAASATNVQLTCNTENNAVAFDQNGGLIDFAQSAQLYLQCGETVLVVEISPTTGSIR